MALLFFSVPCDNITATIGQAFFSVKTEKMAAGCDDF